MPPISMRLSDFHAAGQPSPAPAIHPQAADHSIEKTA
jgi:hypothetical protein